MSDNLKIMFIFIAIVVFSAFWFTIVGIGSLPAVIFWIIIGWNWKEIKEWFEKL